MSSGHSSRRRGIDGDEPALDPVADAPEDEAPRRGFLWKLADTVPTVGVVRGVVAAAIAYAVGLRAYIALTSVGALDSDEAVPGLMARHVLAGEIPIFYWGQAYGGAIEPLLTAGVFAVAGSEVWSLRIVPILFFVAAAVVAWRVGIRVVGPRAAALGAALWSFWPIWSVWKSMKAHGFYGALVFFGLLFVLLTLRLAESPGLARGVALGVVGGLGWWSSPQIALVVLPCLVWLALRKQLRYVFAIAAGAVAGALPWLAWNIRNDWASLEPVPGLPESTYLDHLESFFVYVLPTAFGFRVPRSLEWVFAFDFVAWMVYGSTALALVGAAFLALRSPRRPVAILALIALAYPFIYSLSPHAWYADEPRYAILLVPVVCLAIGSFVARSALMTLVILSFLAVTSFTGVRGLERGNVMADIAGGVKVPDDIGPLLRELRRHEVRFVIAHYWLAYRITFETDEEIIATASFEPRYPPHDGAVRGSGDAAHVFLEGMPEADSFGQTPGYERVEVDGFVMFVPDTS